MTLVELMAAYNLAGLPRERYLRAVRMAQRDKHDSSEAPDVAGAPHALTGVWAQSNPRGRVRGLKRARSHRNRAPSAPPAAHLPPSW